jgi:hypothetical protein
MMLTEAQHANLYGFTSSPKIRSFQQDAASARENPCAAQRASFVAAHLPHFGSLEEEREGRFGQKHHS